VYLDRTIRGADFPSRDSKGIAGASGVSNALQPTLAMPSAEVQAIAYELGPAQASTLGHGNALSNSASAFLSCASASKQEADFKADADADAEAIDNDDEGDDDDDEDDDTAWVKARP